jgi:putative redox protein
MTLAVTSLKTTFHGSQQALLDARLDLPLEIAPRAYVILAHCFTCTKETLTTARVARGLAQQGYGVLRFDFTGLGGSEGEFADTNFSSMVADILCAQDFLAQHYQPASAMVGHSMGGTASLLASLESEVCKTVVTLASPSQPSHVLHHFGPVLQKLDAGEEACITVAGVSYPVKPQFVADVRRFDMSRDMAAYTKPVMAVRAGQDALVRSQDAEAIAGLTSGPSRILDIAGADHLFSDRAHTTFMIGEMAAWLNRYAL